MKREVLRTATIQQGRAEMNETEFRRFLTAIGFKPRKGGTFEVRVDSEVFGADEDDDDDEATYVLNWRVKTE